MKKNLENKVTIERVKYFLIRRLSPFLLLSLFLVFYFCYAILTQAITLITIILLPFIIANSMYVDIALWNYFQGRKKSVIWLTESVVAVLIIYWVTWCFSQIKHTITIFYWNVDRLYLVVVINDNITQIGKAD